MFPELFFPKSKSKMNRLNFGDPAPSFAGVDQNGQALTLENFRGRKVVLYFYPKDNTPGCTAQACNLRDNYDLLLKQGFQVIGISPDSEKSHLNFIGKFNLPFPLIADKDAVIAQAFGVWGEKSMYGKTYMGIFRTTFIISEDGLIQEIIDKVDTKGHAAQILK